MIKIIMITLMICSTFLYANERLNKPEYKLKVYLNRSSVIIKAPLKCNKYLPNFGKFSEICDKEKIDEQKIFALADLNGEISLLGDNYRWAAFDDYAFYFESPIENNQTLYTNNINLTRIINVYDPGAFSNFKEQSLYPYLISATFTLVLKKKKNDKEDVVKEWIVKLTKKNPSFKINIPPLDKGIMETNTYNMDKQKECIDGKVWIKKYKNMSGDTCEWKELINLKKEGE